MRAVVRVLGAGLPTSGWQVAGPPYGWNPGGSLTWDVGSPNEPVGKFQIAAWTYVILPYMEQRALYQGPAAIRVETPIPWMHCPTRRPAILFPEILGCGLDGSFFSTVARNDYAACDADIPNPECNSGGWVPGPGHRGVCYSGSQITSSMIIDGLSNTYFGGEKSICSAWYFTGQSGGDDDGMYIGGNIDTLRVVSTGITLTADRPDWEDRERLRQLPMPTDSTWSFATVRST